MASEGQLTADRDAAVIRLTVVRGPAHDPVEVTKNGAVIGRSSGCEVRLGDGTVSRRHAEIRHLAGRWMLADLGGANGTWINDVRLDSGAAVPMAPGDRIGIGPWVLQVGAWSPTTVAMTGGEDQAETEGEIRRVDPAASGRMVHHRLELLIHCAGRINAAEDQHALCEALLESMIEGTGYGRAAMIRLVGDDEGVEVLGVSARDGTPPDAFSRSLVVRASCGETVTLASEQQQGSWGQSIAELDIHSAMCCPIIVDEQVAACLYLDARGEEARVAADAAGFCQALAQLGGLAMANLKRRVMQARQRELDEEMAAAREAQQLMVPLKQTDVGCVRYAIEFHPGRVASGDLFDVVQLPDDRVGVMLGDVSGKGVGAAILMAAAQAYLHAALCRHGCPGAAVAELNEFLIARSASNRFVTLWVGIFAADGSLTFVDAGHGYWARCRDDGITTYEAAHSPLVGAIDGIEFEAHHVQLHDDERVVLMTDGIPEQPSSSGEQFGTERIREVLSRTRTCEEDVRELLGAIREWAGQSSLADDTTVASVCFMADRSN